MFVEKPLALNDDQLESVLEAATVRRDVDGRLQPPLLAAGAACERVFRGRDTPLSMLYRVNAGRIPKDHWTQNAEEGGGRIVGEVCHFIDLMQYSGRSAAGVCLCGIDQREVEQDC